MPTAAVFDATTRTYDAARANAIQASAEYKSVTQTTDRQALGSDTSDATGAQNPYDRAKTYVAYGYGLTGAGVKVGIVDSGFNIVNGQPRHNEVSSAGKITVLQSTAPLQSDAHGAHVSGLAVGDRSGTAMMGVAYNALLYLGIAPSTAVEDLSNRSGAEVPMKAIAASWAGAGGEVSRQPASARAFASMICLVAVAPSPALAFATSDHAPTAPGAVVRSVSVGGLAMIDACETIAKVADRPEGGGKATVRAAPHLGARATDRLVPGATVFVCDGASARWAGVVYAAGGRASIRCGVSTPVATARPYRGPCRSGWLDEHDLVVIAG